MIRAWLTGLLLFTASAAWAEDTVTLGFNYPRTGPYYSEGLDQLRAAKLAVEEVNAAGGILGRRVVLAVRDTQSKPDVARANAQDLIDRDHAQMLFGGASSGVAVAVGEVAEARGVPFFGTLTYSTATTGAEGHRHTFRECTDSWFSAKILGKWMKANFPGKKVFFVTADYTWGWTTEAAIRRVTGTTDTAVHGVAKVPFPNASAADIKGALQLAAAAKPDVLVVVLFGQDMVAAVNFTASGGLRKVAQVVVPNITLAMAEGAGPENMEGVVGTIPWDWAVPAKYGYARGVKFVQDFTDRYDRYPSTAGASAYTIVHEYKAAVERAKSFDGAAVVRALEGHRYALLKDEQVWRDFDHQSVQSIYLVRGKPPALVRQDRFQLDYFEILDVMAGKDAAPTRAEWDAARAVAKKPKALERLPGEPPADRALAAAKP